MHIRGCVVSVRAIGATTGIRLSSFSHRCLLLSQVCRSFFQERKKPRISNSGEGNEKPFVYVLQVIYRKAKRNLWNVMVTSDVKRQQDEIKWKKRLNDAFRHHFVLSPTSDTIIYTVYKHEHPRLYTHPYNGKNNDINNRNNIYF